MSSGVWTTLSGIDPKADIILESSFKNRRKILEDEQKIQDNELKLQTVDQKNIQPIFDRLRKKLNNIKSKNNTIPK